MLFGGHQSFCLWNCFYTWGHRKLDKVMEKSRKVVKFEQDKRVWTLSMFYRGHNCSIKNFIEIINLIIIFIFSKLQWQFILTAIFFSDFRDLETHQLRCKWCHFLHGISWLTTLPSHQVMSVCTLFFWNLFATIQNRPFDLKLLFDFRSTL